jgi:energy-coupling factor transport system ATP-binding protein
MKKPTFYNLDFLSQKRVSLVKGDNFSGRSTLLQQCIKVNSSDTKSAKALYIGSEIGDYRSGIAPTVRAELRLCSGCDFHDMKTAALAKEIGLFDLLDQNPGTLSGGQQAALIVVNLLNKSSETIAIDCSLEQIDLKKRNAVFDWIDNNITGEVSTIIADNRCDEYSNAVEDCDVSSFIQFAECSSNKISDINPLSDVNPIMGKPEKIEVRNLTFAYERNKLILDNASIILESGTVYHLCGDNGAGKSTFAKLLTGVIRANSGSFYFDNIRKDPWLSPGDKVTYHLQDADDQLQCGGKSPSVLGEIMEGLQVMNISQSEIDGFTRSIVNVFGLKNVLDVHPFDLPFSVRKRIALAACLAPGKPWIILDEPTLGQDSRSIKAIAEIVKQRVNAGVSFIIISHSESFRIMIDGIMLAIANKKINKIPGLRL